jgi:hypothetical protein
MAVNLESEDFGLEARARSWFELFRDPAMVKVDTGQNIWYCVQVLESLLGALWDIIRSMFGYKEGFGL